MQKPFASMRATVPRLTILLAVNFIHMSEPYITGMTVKGTGHWRLILRVKAPSFVSV